MNLPSWFYHLVTWNHENDLVGISLEDESSILYSLDAEKIAFTIGHAIDSVYPFSDRKLGFHDYSNDTIGIVNFSEFEVAWTTRVKSWSDIRFIGADRESGDLVIQEQKLVRRISGEGIERDSDILGKEEIQAIGKDWRVIRSGNEQIIEMACGSLVSHVTNDLRFCQRFGEYLVLFVWQGAARVVSLAGGDVVCEVRNDVGSQFSEAFLARDGRLMLTQHYFDRPRETIVRSFPDLQNEEIKPIVIPCAGRYVFVGRGEGLAFAARKRYCTRSGGDGVRF